MSYGSSYVSADEDVILYGYNFGSNDRTVRLYVDGLPATKVVSKSGEFVAKLPKELFERGRYQISAQKRVQGRRSPLEASLVVYARGGEGENSRPE